MYRIPGIEPRVLGPGGKRSVAGLYSPASTTNILVKLVIWIKVLATKPADLMLILTDIRLHQKSYHNDPGRSRDLQETLCPSHWLQTIETIVSEKLEFPQGISCWEEEKAEGWCQPEQEPSWQRDKIVLTYSEGYGLGSGTRVTRAGCLDCFLNSSLVFYFNLSLIDTHSKEFGEVCVCVGGVHWLS